MHSKHYTLYITYIIYSILERIIYILNIHLNKVKNKAEIQDVYHDSFSRSNIISPKQSI
jgi:hypothetical protein